jgi:putative ABC transport system substrate-binding protein
MAGPWVGILETIPAARNAANLDALRKGLRDLGYVEAGGLIAYAVNYPDIYFRFATFIDKIFKGAKPGELPVEQPTKFELVINSKTAKALGLTIPQSALLRADQVVQ